MAKTNSTVKSTIKRLGYILVIIAIHTSCADTKSKLPEWIIGNWQANVNGIRVNENWELNENTLSAQTTTYYDKNPQIERVRLTLTNDTLYYAVSIDNHNVCFTCGKPYNDTLIFVNNTNEFPKRIIYTKPENDEMKVWIENFEGDPNRIDYPFKKIN